MSPQIVAAVSVGHLQPVSVTHFPFERGTDAAGRGFMAPARAVDGTCGFRHEERCSLQVAGGERMLPTACRHFPRVYRREPNGDRLTLSHYCPTAAALLFDASPITIVSAEPPLALETSTEGLDVREALPPLLRPGMLMDGSGYAAWEELVVASFANAASVDEAFARVTAATERIRRWHPNDGPLEATVHNGFTGRTFPVDGDRLSQGFQVLAAVTGQHPLLVTPRNFSSAWRTARGTSADVLDGPLRRYLAACTFANWVAYRGQGLRSVLEWVCACFDVFRLQVTRAIERDGRLTRENVTRAFRDSDYLVVHTVDSLAFGRAIATVE